MNLINSLYVSSQIPLIVLLISLTIAIMTVNTFRYGEILIPTIIFAILMVANIGAKFNIVKKDDKLTLKSKTEYYKSITVRILNETKNAYVVEYHGKLQYIDK